MAKFCKNCGTELKEGAICQNCGTVNEKVKKELESNKSSDNKKEDNKNYTNTNQTNNTTNGSYTGMYQNQQNSMALIGFILSLVSFFCCGFCNILGLVFSIIGYSQASKYSDTNNNKGLAIAGIVISSISIALTVFATIFGSVFSFGFFSKYYK